MNIRFSLILSLLVFSCIAAAAQTPAPPAGNTAGAPPQTTAPASVPKMKVGIINILAFRDNIAEMRQRYEKLQAEFAPLSNEIESMNSKLEAQQKTLQEKGTTMTPVQAKKLSDDIEELKRQVQRKTEDTQALARKREEEETGPIFDKINTFMTQYAQKHGLTMVLEASSIGPAILYAAAEANITVDFINEYNKANPVTAAASTPAPGATTATKPAPGAASKNTPGRRPGR